MFLHLLKYRLKMFLKPSDEIFWCIAFPFILATLFYLAFGKTTETTEIFSSIPVAVIKEANADQYALDFLTSISSTADTPLITIKDVPKEEADSLLLKGEIKGILYVSDSLSMKVNDNDFEESILKTIIDQYLSTSATIKDLAKKDPLKIPSAISSLSTSIDANKEITLNKHQNNDSMTSYFYALIAMACLFHCFLGFKAMTSTQANLSALAARRCITPTHKLSLILSDFLGSFIIGYSSLCVLICYLAFLLRVNFGDRLPFVFLIALIGSIIGITMGFFISSIGKGSIALKGSFMVAFSMVLCFLSGLMFNGMLNVIEHYCPIINRINPAALISDAIYSLSIYDSYDRFFMDFGILLLLSVLLILGSFLLTRRERYANI